MKNGEVGQVSTSNLAEVQYLVDYCHHRIVDVGMQASWPYGIEELCITLEGENIELDHGNYLRHGRCTLAALEGTFAAVMQVIRRKEEEAFFQGQGSRGGLATKGGRP